MKITEDLKIQLERLKNTGAYILNKRMKKELQELTRKLLQLLPYQVQPALSCRFFLIS